MADFIKAVEWMKEGKKVRRKVWADKGNYWYLNQPDEMHADIMGHHEGQGERKDKEVGYFSADLFLGKDWQIYREKK